MFLMARILITGGTGFIGSHLALALLAQGNNEVHLTSRYDKLPIILSDIVGNKPIFHNIDISNIPKLEELLVSIRPERIYHLAACIHRRGDEPAIQELLATNVVATAALLRHAKTENIPMVNTATFTEYASSATPVDEHAPLGPQDAYGISKLAATLLCEIEGKKGAPVVTLRLFTPYGPEIPGGRLMHAVVEQALLHKPISLSSPTVTRDFTYVGDIAEAFMRAGDRADRLRGEIINIGSGKGTTLKELGGIVLELCNSTSVLNFGSEKSLPYDGELWQSNNAKAKNLLDWAPKTDLRNGLLKTIAWYKKSLLQHAR
jgi:nucleoside-diphosphate-sugar epimerase